MDADMEFLKRVHEFIKSQQHGVTVNDIAKHFGRRYQAIYCSLNSMDSNGILLYEEGKKLYAFED